MAADPEEKSDSNFRRETQRTLTSPPPPAATTAVEEQHGEVEQDPEPESDFEEVKIENNQEEQLLNLEQEQGFEEDVEGEYESDESADGDPDQSIELDVEPGTDDNNGRSPDDDNNGRSPSQQATPSTASSWFFSDCSDSVSSSSDLDYDYERSFSRDEANSNKDIDQDFTGPFCPCCDRWLPGTRLDEWPPLPAPPPSKKRRIE